MVERGDGKVRFREPSLVEQRAEHEDRLIPTLPFFLDHHARVPGGTGRCAAFVRLRFRGGCRLQVRVGGERQADGALQGERLRRGREGQHAASIAPTLD